MFSIRQTVTALIMLASVAPAAAEINCARPASFINVANLYETLSGGSNGSDLRASVLKARFSRRPICMAALLMSSRVPDCTTRFMTVTLD